MEIRSRCSLQAVVGPESLRPVRRLDAVGERLLAMGAGERDVAGRVPVLGEEDVLEGPGEHIDCGDDRKAAMDFERSAVEQEVVLHVDHQECVVPGEVHEGILVGLAGVALRLGR